MPFDAFLRRHLAELVRFAVVLTGDSQRAEDLVARVMVVAFPYWSQVVVIGRPFSVLRAGVARSFLAESARTAAGAGTAETVAAETGTAETGAARRRAVTALAVYSGQSVDEIAAALGTTPTAVREHLDAQWVTGRAPGRRAELLAEFDRLADRVSIDDARLGGMIVDRLEAAPAPDAAVFEQLFAPIAAGGPAFADDATSLTPAPSRNSDEWPDDAGDTAPAGVVRSWRRPGLRVGRAVVAVVIVTLAVSLAVLVSRDRPRPVDDAVPPPTTRPSTRPDAVPVDATSAVPAATGATASPVGRTLPGTRIIRRSYGAGSAVISIGAYALAPGHQLAVNATCSGPGTVRVGPVQIPQCDGEPVGGVSVAQIRSLQVTADPTTTWQLAVVDEPEHGTDGSLHYPVSGLLRSASAVERVGAASGTGSRTVPLTSGTTTARVEDVRLILTCSGTGVSFASADGRFDGQYTTTCFAGWSYEFDVPGALLPGTLTVHASATTAWRLVVIRG